MVDGGVGDDDKTSLEYMEVGVKEKKVEKVSSNTLTSSIKS